MDSSFKELIKFIRQKIEAGQHHHNIIKLIPQITNICKGEHFDLNICLMPNLNRKDNHTKEIKHNPFIPPFEEGKFILDLEQTHCLLYNKFPLYYGHILLCPKNFERQHSPLSFQDIKHTLSVTIAQHGLYFLNSGKDAGTTQPHKHVQCLPEQANKAPLAQKLQNYCKKMQDLKKTNILLRYQGFNFQHGIVVFQKNLNFLNLVETAYSGYRQLQKDLIATSNGNNFVYHNLLGTENYMLMVPRKSSNMFEGMGVNSLIFVGIVMVQKQEHLQKFEGKNASEIFKNITFVDREELNLKKEQISKLEIVE